MVMMMKKRKNLRPRKEEIDLKMLKSKLKLSKLRDQTLRNSHRS